MKQLIELVNPKMSELVPYVSLDSDRIGWCSSCDKVFLSEEFVQTENRSACPNCGDWLLFAETEEDPDAAVKIPSPDQRPVT